LDPAQVEDLERKRRANLAHKREIEAQIEEKRRIKQLEEELQELDNQKVENEAREQLSHNLYSNEIKKQQPQFKNFEKILNSGNQQANGNDERASVLQGEMNKYDKDSQTARSNVTDTRASEIHRAMQQAELAAAEEKHKKLLKRLQRGGHDTRQLEKKFAELKARLTGKPIPMPQQHYQSQVGSENEASSQRGRGLNEGDWDLSEEKKRQKLNRIFQMMQREDTNSAMPAELSEENLKQLLNRYFIIVIQLV
jgi:hypothetical protein